MHLFLIGSSQGRVLRFDGLESGDGTTHDCKVLAGVLSLSLATQPDADRYGIVEMQMGNRHIMMKPVKISPSQDLFVAHITDLEEASAYCELKVNLLHVEYVMLNFLVYQIRHIIDKVERATNETMDNSTFANSMGNTGEREELFDLFDMEQEEDAYAWHTMEDFESNYLSRLFNLNRAVNLDLGSVAALFAPLQSLIDSLIETGRETAKETETRTNLIDSVGGDNRDNRDNPCNCNWYLCKVIDLPSNSCTCNIQLIMSGANKALPDVCRAAVVAYAIKVHSVTAIKLTEDNQSQNENIGSNKNKNAPFGSPLGSDSGSHSDSMDWDKKGKVLVYNESKPQGIGTEIGTGIGTGIGVEIAPLDSILLDKNEDEEKPFSAQYRVVVSSCGNSSGLVLVLQLPASISLSINKNEKNAENTGNKDRAQPSIDSIDNVFVYAYAAYAISSLPTQIYTAWRNTLELLHTFFAYHRTPPFTSTGTITGTGTILVSASASLLEKVESYNGMLQALSLSLSRPEQVGGEKFPSDISATIEKEKENDLYYLPFLPPTANTPAPSASASQKGLNDEDEGEGGGVSVRIRTPEKTTKTTEKELTTNTELTDLTESQTPKKPPAPQPPVLPKTEGAFVGTGGGGRGRSIRIQQSQSRTVDVQEAKAKAKAKNHVKVNRKLDLDKI